jgi:hypothetical protein
MRGVSLGVDLGDDRGVPEPLVRAPEIDPVRLPPPGNVAPKVPASVHPLALAGEVSRRPAAPGPGTFDPNEDHRSGYLSSGPLSRMFRRMSEMARGSGRI